MTGNRCTGSVVIDCGEIGMRLNWFQFSSGKGLVVGFCEHSNELNMFHKRGEFLDQIISCHFVLIGNPTIRN